MSRALWCWVRRTSMTAENIDNFCSYFQQQVVSRGLLVIHPPDSAAGHGSEFRYRKALYVTAINALAGLRYTRSRRATAAVPLHRPAGRDGRVFAWPSCAVREQQHFQPEGEDSRARNEERSGRLRHDGGLDPVTQSSYARFSTPAAKLRC